MLAIYAAWSVGALAANDQMLVTTLSSSHQAQAFHDHEYGAVLHHDRGKSQDAVRESTQVTGDRESNGPEHSHHDHAGGPSKMCCGLTCISVLASNVFFDLLSPENVSSVPVSPVADMIAYAPDLLYRPPIAL